MTRLEKYEAVNNCKTLKELAAVIRLIAEDGYLQGRSRAFDADLMAQYCENYSWDTHNVLTREFGIRQQAIMILFYDNIRSPFSDL